MEVLAKMFGGHCTNLEAQEKMFHLEHSTNEFAHWEHQALGTVVGDTEQSKMKVPN